MPLRHTLADLPPPLPPPPQLTAAARHPACRERRIAERRERVQERLRQQQQQCDKLGANVHVVCCITRWCWQRLASFMDRPLTAAVPAPSTCTAGSAAPPPPADLQLGKGKAAAAASTEVVRRAHMAATAEAEGVRQAPEARTDEHHEACDAEEAALREQVAAEAEASQRENRAIDLEWERLQVGGGWVGWRVVGCVRGDLLSGDCCQLSSGTLPPIVILPPQLHCRAWRRRSSWPRASRWRQRTASACWRPRKECWPLCVRCWPAATTSTCGFCGRRARRRMR